VHVPKLLRFKVDSDRREDGIWIIKRGAPLLRDLGLCQPFGRGRIRPQWPGDIVLRSAELRTLRLETEIISGGIVFLLKGRHTPRVDGLLPGLRHMSLVARVRCLWARAD
jgi:hypothetical protein